MAELQRRIELGRRAACWTGVPAATGRELERGLAARTARGEARLYHHPDGARVAYREAGPGPALALLHSAAAQPSRSGSRVVEHLTDRFRVVLPDLPLHGDSEDRPRHPYTLDWFAEVLGGVLRARCSGRGRCVAGHDVGAELLLRAVAHAAAAPRRASC